MQSESHDQAGCESKRTPDAGGLKDAVEQKSAERKMALLRDRMATLQLKLMAAQQQMEPQQSDDQDTAFPT